MARERLEEQHYHLLHIAWRGVPIVCPVIKSGREPNHYLKTTPGAKVPPA
jgi:hypothetical protein